MGKQKGRACHSQEAHCWHTHTHKVYQWQLTPSLLFNYIKIFSLTVMSWVLSPFMFVNHLHTSFHLILTLRKVGRASMIISNFHVRKRARKSCMTSQGYWGGRWWSGIRSPSIFILGTLCIYAECLVRRAVILAGYCGRFSKRRIQRVFSSCGL